VAAVGGRGFGNSAIGDVVIDQAAVEALIHGPAGPVGRLIVDLAQTTAQLAKRNAPVGERSSKTPGGHPSGWLRSQIGWTVGVEGGDVVADIVSPALTSPANPKPGEPYSLYMERPGLRPYGVPAWVRAKEGPYLVPALEEAIRTRLGGQ
jgi:hypothetical protein